MPYAGQVDKTMGADTVGHLKHLLDTELRRAREENDLDIAMFLGVDGRIFSSSIPDRLEPREYRLLNLLTGNLAHICNQLSGQNMMMSVQQFEAGTVIISGVGDRAFLVYLTTKPVEITKMQGGLGGPGPRQEIVTMAYDEVGTTAPYMTASHWDRFLTELVDRLREIKGDTVAAKAEKEWRAYLKQVLASFV